LKAIAIIEGNQLSEQTRGDFDGNPKLFSLSYHRRYVITRYQIHKNFQMLTQIYSKVKILAKNTSSDGANAKSQRKLSLREQVEMNYENFIVQTEHGPIQGVQRITKLGRDYVSFQGIPYMKPPVGRLRFQDPQEPNKWKDPLDVSTENESYCFYHPSEAKGGQEDAGTINVFVPVNSNSDLLPVMVFIHGGGFQMGSSKTDFYGPDFLLQRDVIIVTLNYRLGPFGFLSLKDPSLKIPGNAGLKDQCFALKWVQRNIEKFSGNPRNVTLFGDGAGAASTHFHMISDQSKDLFQKAILMSGCAFNKTWALSSPRDFADRLGRKLGWDGSGGEKKLLEVLEAAEPHEIMQHSVPNKFLTDEEFSEFLIFPFVPVIEPYVTATTFIDKDPILMARNAWSNQIDCIIGANSFEGAFATIFERKEQFIDVFENASYFAPLTELGLKNYDGDAARFGSRIKKLYFEYAHVGNTNFELFCQFSSDRHFWHGLQNAVKSRINSEGEGETYFYRFDASTDLNILKKYNKCESFQGATHGDTIFYLFSSAFLTPPTIDSKEFELIKKMTELWTNFAANGSPNDAWEISDWEPVVTTKPPLVCLNISEKKIEMIALPESDRLMIWDTLFKDAKIEMF
jgi:cholinesterase